MKAYLLVTLLIFTCVAATYSTASDRNNTANMANATQQKGGSLADASFRFTDAERNEYKSQYNKQAKDKKHSDLPPGLQKKVDRGSSLPPGWQKKVNNGEVFAPELRSYSKRSPYPSPRGTSDYILQDKVIRVMDSTSVILDVLSN